jgi:hypothetical protein
MKNTVKKSIFEFIFKKIRPKFQNKALKGLKGLIYSQDRGLLIPKGVNGV